MIHMLSLIHNYDAGTVSVTSIASVAGKMLFLTSDYLIGWTLEILDSCNAGVEIIPFAASHRCSQCSMMPVA